MNGRRYIIEVAGIFHGATIQVTAPNADQAKRSAIDEFLRDFPNEKIETVEVTIDA